MPETLTLLSTLAVMGALQELLPGYAAASVSAQYGPTRDLLALIEGGTKADLAILTDDAIDGLIASGTLVAGGRLDLARSYVGLAVRGGAPHPPIGTVAAFRQTLLDAPSIVYSAAGASGQVFAGLIERLGVADAVRAKAIVIPTGLTGAVLAEGGAALAVQQVSELMVVPGIEVIGRIPDALHQGAMFSGGLFSGAAPDAAALLRALASPVAAPVYRRHGVEPVAAA